MSGSAKRTRGRALSGAPAPDAARRGKAGRWLALALLAALAASGCSLNYTATEIEAPGAADLPDTVATGVTYRVVRGSRLSLEIQAERTESYDNRKETVITAARFKELDGKGELATEGSADTVRYHTDTENAEISGSVYVYSASQKADLSTEYLTWSGKQKLLIAEPNELVVIRKDDGSRLSGTGFAGDFRTREVRFSGPVNGTYVYEKEK